jgi:hypothetical protein
MGEWMPLSWRWIRTWTVLLGKNILVEVDFDLGTNVRIGSDGKLLFDLRYTNPVTLQVAGQNKVLTSSGLSDEAFLTLDPSDGTVLAVYEIKGSGNEYTFITNFQTVNCYYPVPLTVLLILTTLLQ